MAREAAVSKSRVQRIWSHNDIKPHRLETFKISNDPNLGFFAYPNIADAIAKLRLNSRVATLPFGRRTESFFQHTQ
jgi:hypothetical protein